jgi:hypothetical protein
VRSDQAQLKLTTMKTERNYVVGLGKGEASPGGEVILSVEMTADFTTNRLFFGEDTQCFEVLWISVDDQEVPIVRDVRPSMPGSDAFLLQCRVKSCQWLRIAFRNMSDVRAKIRAAVMGTVQNA